MAVSNRVRAALTTTVLTTAATGFMAGCAVGGETTTRSPTAPTRTARSSTTTTATTTTTGRVRGLFFLYLGGFRPGLPVGTVLPARRHPDQPHRHRRPPARRACPSPAR